MINTRFRRRADEEALWLEAIGEDFVAFHRDRIVQMAGAMARAMRTHCKTASNWSAALATLFII